MRSDKIRRLFSRYLFSEDLSRDARTLNVVCIIGFFAGFVTLAVRVIEGLPIYTVIIMVAYIVSIVILFVIANYFNAHQMAATFTIIAVGDILWPLTFFLIGGIDGAMSAWFVLSIFIVFFYASGAKFVMYITIHGIVIIGCYLMGYLHPEWVYSLTPAQRVAEHFLSVFLSGLFIGITVKYLISIYDSERKNAEAASRTKSNFLSTMSHEMRTPMNAIIGMTAIAKAASDPQKKDYALDRIDEASEHLLGVISDILDMSKIEAGKLELSDVEFNINRTLQKVKTIVTPRVSEKNLSFFTEIDRNIPSTLISDDQRLTQVILNLLSNAVKFTEENGTIAVKADLLGEDDGIYEIQIEVSDTGIGLSEEQISRLFGSFEQAESGTARKYGGTGLGLAISKNIIDLLGGIIWVKSKPGEGSQFFFTFKAPAGAGEDVLTGSADDFTLPADDGEPEASLEGKRVLLAEDNEINREIVLALLEPTGIVIDCAENGAEALAKFKAAPQGYGMILMDCMMPEMDGYEATQSIRNLDDPYARRIPIVAMTANVFKEDIEKCLASGMNAHIGKPIGYEKLVSVLREYLL
ncbi:MAG: response regulator [Oscillospiraceae bacterium]|jgi:signal transduction histidine kinase|nr:response regulator [Oscillospiraceae bacterium]